MIANEDEARAFVAERCSDTAFARLERLQARLTEENARQNLVSAGSLPSLWQRHIADSAQLLDFVPASLTGPWIDLGTGAGFPGLIVAIMRPEWPVHLVESRRLRVDWLTSLVDSCALPHCTVVGSRLEVVPTAPYAVISARAFAPLAKLVPLARRFSTSDTVWLLPKGRSAAQEVADLPRRLRHMFHVEPSATDPEAGIVTGRMVEDNGR